MHRDNNNLTNPVSMEAMYNDVEHVFMAGTLSLIMIASLVGNSMVCFTVYKKRRLRTRNNSFIINLALADLGVVVFCMPFSLITCLKHYWTLGDVMCQLNGILNIVFTQTSLLSLTAIAIDKYCAIVWPLKKVMTVRRALYLITWTWLQPVFIAVIPFAGLYRYRFKPGTTQCGPEFPRNLLQSIFGVFVCVIGYFIPLVILGYVYIKIFHSAKQSARRISRVSITSAASNNSLSTHKKVAITVMILVLLFMFCWTPYFVYVIIIIADPLLASNTHVLALGKASYWMAFLCSALNSYIYGARNPQFRNEFKLILCCICPCLARPLRVKGCAIVSSSRGSWGRMGGSKESNTVNRYGFAYSPYDREGSWEGMRGLSDLNVEQRYDFAYSRYGQHFMGLKRNRTPGGWRHKRLSDSTMSESNQDDSNTDCVRNETSLGVRPKASLQLRFESDQTFQSQRCDDELNDQRIRSYSNHVDIDIDIRTKRTRSLSNHSNYSNSYSERRSDSNHSSDSNHEQSCHNNHDNCNHRNHTHCNCELTDKRTRCYVNTAADNNNSDNNCCHSNCQSRSIFRTFMKDVDRSDSTIRRQRSKYKCRWIESAV